MAADQSRAAVVAQAAGVGALLQVTSWSLVLLASATFVQFVLGMRMLVPAESRHDLCRDLIASGDVPVELPVVRGEMDRLADPRHPARLARSLDEIAQAAIRPDSRRLGEELARVRFLLVVDEATSGGG